MNDLFEFLTGQEAIVVYMVAILSSILCSIIYLVEKNNQKLRRRHNTRELNKLVEQVQEEMPLEEEPIVYHEPVLEVETEEKAPSVVEMLEETAEVKKEREEFQEVSRELAEDFIMCSVEDDADEELEYTTIEPDSETAQLELQKLREELARQAEIENEGMTSYEEEQEENAIISLDEWLQKSQKMYAENEATQYEEGNVPISLHELEQKAGRKVDELEDTFVLEEAINPEELEVKEVVEEQKFKTSPIISPVFGIEKESNYNDIELENTATYEKLDLESKKTNEFLMTLKDLQEKLE